MDDKGGVFERDLDVCACVPDRLRSGDAYEIREEDGENEYFGPRAEPVGLADAHLPRERNNRVEEGGVRDPERLTRFDRRWYAGVVLSVSGNIPAVGVVCVS